MGTTTFRPLLSITPWSDQLVRMTAPRTSAHVTSAPPPHTPQVDIFIGDETAQGALPPQTAGIGRRNSILATASDDGAGSGAAKPSYYAVAEALRVKEPTEEDWAPFRERLYEAFSEFGPPLVLTREGSAPHVETLRLAHTYARSRTPGPSELNTLLDAQARELSARIASLRHDLVHGEAAEIRLAATIIGELPAPALYAREGLAESVLIALSRAADDPDSAVHMDSTIALAKLARTLYHMAGVVAPAVEAVCSAIARHIKEAHGAQAPLLTLIRHIDRLTSDPEDPHTLMPGLRPHMSEIQRGIALMEDMGAQGITAKVRTAAKDALDALNARIRNYSFDEE